VTSLTSYMVGIPKDIGPQINLIVQLGPRKDPKVPAQVPLLLDLVKGDTKKEAAAKVLSLAFASINRPFAVAPNVPPDRVKTLRRAFEATMQDPQFIEEAEKMNADLSPSTGEQVQAVVEEALSCLFPVSTYVPDLRL